MDSISFYDSIYLDLTNLNAGMMAVDPNSGAILMWIGGVDYRTHPYDEVRAKRQIASTFKPILYAAALEKGIDPCKYISISLRLMKILITGSRLIMIILKEDIFR